MPIRSSSLVRPCEVLAVVDGEIQMMQSMVCGSINHVLEPMTGDHIRIVNEHRPDIDADEEREVEMFLDGEEIGEDMVGERLEITVDWVESVRGEGGRYDPFVMGFVDVFVDEWVVLPSVDPVNAVVGEEQEPNHLHL